MAARRPNRSPARPARSNVTRNISTPVSPVVNRPVLPPKPSTLPPPGNPVEKARAIIKRGKTPIEKARATVSPVLPVRPTISTPTPTPKQPFGCGTPGAGDWGEAAKQNATLRQQSMTFTPKGPVFTEPPIYYVMMMVNHPLGGDRPPVPMAMPCPNPKYKIPPPPPKPDPVAPKTESIITKIVDEIIEDSKEVVKEVVVKQEPVREPVVVTQDVVTPPPPITPIEIVLENQAACEKEVTIPEINIVNEFSPTIDLQQNVQQTGSNVNVEQTTNIELRGGCMDPDAINYDPNALIQIEGACVYEPPPEEEEEVVLPEEDPPIVLDIPQFIPFVSSHGETVFQVPKDLVETTLNTGVAELFTLPSKVKVEANLDLVDTITRPTLEDSDLIVSEEPKEHSDKKAIRSIVGGELASDTKLPSDEEIVIIGNREKIKKELVRNSSGVITLTDESDIKLNIDLRCQSFKYRQYKKNIDTDFSELLGKL